MKISLRNILILVALFGVGFLVTKNVHEQRQRKARLQVQLIHKVFDENFTNLAEPYPGLVFFAVKQNESGNWSMPTSSLWAGLKEKFRPLNECDEFFFCSKTDQQGVLYYVEVLDWSNESGDLKAVIDFGMIGDGFGGGVRGAVYEFDGEVWTLDLDGESWVS